MKNSQPVALWGVFIAVMLAAAFCAPARAASPATDGTGCKVWNVQIASIVFAIPRPSNPLEAPFVRMAGVPSESLWLRDYTRCDSTPLNVNFVSFGYKLSFISSGALPLKLNMSLARAADDVALNSTFLRVDPSAVKTKCRDGFDSDIGRRPVPTRVYGCWKDSGRLLVWDCGSSKSASLCAVGENYGPVAISYLWLRKFVDYDKAPQLDDSILEYLNSMIVSGEKLR